MNKYTNGLLIVIIALLGYISVLKTIEIFRNKNQYLYVESKSQRMFDRFPPMKVDAKSGLLYRLTKTEGQYKWVKVK